MGFVRAGGTGRRMGQPVPAGGETAERGVSGQGVQVGGRVNLYLRVKNRRKRCVRVGDGSTCTCRWRNCRKGCVRAGGAGRRVGNSVGEGIQSLSKNQV